MSQKEVYLSHWARMLKKYLGLFLTLALYTVVHEGVRYCQASYLGAFHKLEFYHKSISVTAYPELMTDTQRAVFCLISPVSTLLVSYILMLLTDKIYSCKNDIFRNTMFYCNFLFLIMAPFVCLASGTIANADLSYALPAFLSINAKIVSGILLALNGFLLFKAVYKKFLHPDSYTEENDGTVSLFRHFLFFQLCVIFCSVNV